MDRCRLLASSRQWPSTAGRAERAVSLLRARRAAREACASPRVPAMRSKTEAPRPTNWITKRTTHDEQASIAPPRGVPVKDGEILPRQGYCHPAQSKRTKCACGAVVQLHRVDTSCKCGRWHCKEPGVSAFARQTFQPCRAGGRKGCPGTEMRDAPEPTTETSATCEKETTDV